MIVDEDNYDTRKVIVINGTSHNIVRRTGTMLLHEVGTTLLINGEEWQIIDPPEYLPVIQPEVYEPVNKKHVPFHVQQQMRKKKGGKRGFK